MPKQKGFTLIELLVVIAVIGLLASVVMVALNSARLKARNAKRISDLRQIQKALELYYDTNGSYPSSSGAWRSECVGYGGQTSDQVIPGLVPTYMARFPADPSMNASLSYACYMYFSNGTDYKVLDHNIAPAEVAGFDYNSHPAFYDPLRPTWSWMVCSGEPACTWW